MGKKELRIVATCVVVGAIVFLAGYQLGRAHYQHISTIPVISVAEHESKMRTAAAEYQYPGTLGYPLNTPLTIEGEAYIDGAGFPMQDDLLTLSSVRCDRPSVTLTIAGGRVPDNGKVRYKGHETLVAGKRRFVVTERLPIRLGVSRSGSPP